VFQQAGYCICEPPSAAAATGNRSVNAGRRLTDSRLWTATARCYPVRLGVDPVHSATATDHTAATTAFCRDPAARLPDDDDDDCERKLIIIDAPAYCVSDLELKALTD